MRVFFDTSIVIPMIVANSASNRLVARLRAGGHEISISPGVLREARENLGRNSGLRRWLGVDDATIEDFLEKLPIAFDVARGSSNSGAKSPPTRTTTTSSRRPGRRGPTSSSPRDRHLLNLDGWRGIGIVGRAGMIAELDRRDERNKANPGE